MRFTVLLQPLAALLFLPLAVLAQDNKPPASGDLFSFEGTLDLSGIALEKGASASLDHLKDGSLAVCLEFPTIDGYPGANFPVPDGGWDLSGYDGIQASVTNPGAENVSVYLRVDNKGDWKQSPWSAEVLRLNPGESKPLKVFFGKAFGQQSFQLDPAHIVMVKFYADSGTKPFSVLISQVRAFKSEVAAVKPVVDGVDGLNRLYLTETTSPIDHRHPYGENYELVKDWTFGKNRADATIHNRAELDQEFFYRYIYDKGELDTLSTYWTVHRDYPEDDPRALHVFGDNTLTLKARIPKDGGLRKGGIESGMLRSKFTIGPGMYVEMRAKLTRGIGAWPAFWLNPGVENPDGTFSETPWPPEIDIFEFFNWQGRLKTRELAMNIQINNDPERFGNPYTIFSAAGKNGEFVPGMDFSEGFHVFALDWRVDRPIWILDGHPIKQVYYEWKAPPAHILITNQLGIKFGDMKEMVANESNWDYVIDYIRVWKHVIN